MKRAMEIAKHRYKPESISFLNRAAGQRGNVEEITNSLMTENLRDIKVQEELLDEYLADFQVDTETMETVYELNRKYNEIVQKEEEISRNINWKLLNFKWDNLFNYGEGNSVNFDNLGGIIGVFGKNFSGKSSIIDAILYTLFNTTSKNERKNLNIINQNKEYGSGELEIEVGEKIYKIRRESTKYTKRLHGEETVEAKTDLNFEVYDMTTGEVTSLNGLTRNQTDANIRKHFGSMEDFLVSSLASQHGSLMFLEEGSTRRKEIIAKFLDLEQFDKKFKLAKEDSIDARGALKKFEDRNYDEEYDEAIESLTIHRHSLQAHEQYYETLQVEIDDLSGHIVNLQNSIDSVPAEIIDFTKIKQQHKQKRTQVISLRSENTEQKDLLKKRVQSLLEVVSLIESYDINELIDQRNLISQDREQLSAHETELRNISRNIVAAVNKTKLLEGIPCGDQFPVCKFIRDANAASARLPMLNTERDNTESTCAQIRQRIDDASSDAVEELIRDYEMLLTGRKDIDKNIDSTKLLIERNENAIDKLTLEMKELDTKIREYNENIDAIENLEILISDKDRKQAQLTHKRKLFDDAKKATLEHYRQTGSLEQRVQEIKRAKEDYIKLRREYAAYDLFMRCMHSNGIAYDIIKKKIPVINQEIAEMLTNIVDFEIFFSSNGNKLDIFIKHPLHDERPIEMGSGAEKTVAAMAIRLALLSVSSLPKGDVFILDEPGTALDEENMEGFIRILELIKVYFKNVLLISHLDSLKDCVDMQIVIEKKAGYARVYQ
jgi:exonuclease SbcC